MYFSGVDIIKTFKDNPEFAKYFFINAAIRVLYTKITKSKLRSPYYAGKKVVKIPKANQIFITKLNSDEPLMAARYGSSELFCVTEALLIKYGYKKKVNMEELKVVMSNCGLFPLSENTIIKFSDMMLDCSSQLDIVGAFRSILEDYYIKHYSPNNILISQRNLFDFWNHEIPFTYAFKNKRILVIHPFESTIIKQYEKREKLFDNKYILPQFELLTIKAVQSIANEKCDYKNWFDALDYMFAETKKKRYDIAILGCGAYGFPLAAKIKLDGKKAIHMGGVTQILFGIKGKRWDLDPTVSKMYNEYWVRPEKTDIPQKSREVEDGCYW